VSKKAAAIRQLLICLLIFGFAGLPAAAIGDDRGEDAGNPPHLNVPEIRSGAILPPNFEDTYVTTVSGPIDVDWTPDGRMVIINKNGQVRIYANGALLPTPALDLASRLCTAGEQGLVGLALHPNFAANRYIYLYYISNKLNTSCPESEIDGPVGRLSRFVLPDSNIIDPASEVILLETPPRYRNHHTGGDVKFGSDGYLYIPMGDAGGQSLGWPQDPGILAGKVVRITASGDIPPGNPYTGAGTARCNLTGKPPAGSPAGTKCQEIFASGLRNPFRQAMDPNTSAVHFFMNDVGQHTWEEISEGPVVAGNYGWQVREGPCAKDSDTDCGLPPTGMTDPVHWYHHGPDGGAATGGAFVPNGIWPAPYSGRYLFADYVFGKIYMLEPGGPDCRICNLPTSAYNQVEFATVAQVVSLRFGPYGTGQALYYATRDGSEIRRITYTGTANRAPIAGATASTTSGPVPLTVQFDGSTSSDPDGDPLTYAWDFENDGVTDSTAAVTAHQYSAAGVFTCKLTIRDVNGLENSTTIRIDAGNTPPVPVIETPAEGTLFSVGQRFILRGSGTDPEEGQLAASALTWQVIKHHATHTHPFLEPTVGNDIEIVAPDFEDLDGARTSYLELRLTATDANSLSHTVTRELRPKFVDVTFQTDPPGLQLVIGGGMFTGPATVPSWDGASIAVSALNQTDPSGQTWVFDSWSHGGAAMHTIVTPPLAATYTAKFRRSQVLMYLPSVLR
jgi:glucose/arabinose dehydrogenase/PKD repeat protein